jgi:hypothetical protein
MVRLGIAAGWVCLAAGSALAQDQGVDFFERKIRPVLTEHCYSCHSTEAKKQRGGLLLDAKAGLLTGGDTGPALVPHKPGESLLLKALRYTDPDLRMPPKGKLPDSVVADFEKWVAMGAPDPRTGTSRKGGSDVSVEEGRKFWAFQPPKLHAPPKVKNEAWVYNDIDRFVLGKLEAKNVRPAPDADPGTLIRRLYFVLIGLPPTPEEIDQFTREYAGAKPQAAVMKVVDRLLASPHFGERWGRHWLDVARFAESSGGGRSLMFKDAWRYRDYVIRAFNSDKPFTEFIREQLAGDLLQAKTPEERYWQLVATAFLLLGPHNYERQDKPILEMDIIDEQIDTMGKAFLGMTIGCARCHDHKFDPIPTRDYYALAGIFKSTKFIVHDNVSKWMTQPLPAEADLEQRIRKHEVAVAALKEQIKIAKQKAGVALVPEKGMPVAVAALPGIVIDDTQAKKVGNWKHSTFSNHFVGDGYLYDDRGFKEEKTLTFQPDIAKTGFYEIRLSYVPHTNRATKVGVRVFHTDGDNTVFVDQRQTPPIDGRWVPLGRYRLEQGNQWFVMLTTEGANGHVVGDAVQFLLDDDEDVKKPAPKKAPLSPPVAAGGKATGEKAPTLQALEAQLKKLEQKAPQRPTAMAVAEGDKIGDFYVCIRGNVHNKGETVPRGFLQVATPLSPPLGKGGHGGVPKLTNKQSGRYELADWLASADNPLTARVFANRVWHHLFGAGIVRTMDNFGNTGELPSHPELLDHLAIRFMEEGWSVKKLIREIVLSHTFQQSSGHNGHGNGFAKPQAADVDPENRLLWRYNRRRVDAETLRDGILAVSGQLDRAVYGDNIKKGTAVERDYQFEDTRRSVYTPIFRNRLLELFEVFDFPDPNIVAGRRNISTVPTQALYLMNSPFVMAQARRTAERLLETEEMDDARRLDVAYRNALGRLPTERERQIALAYLRAAETSEQRVAAWERLCQTLFACVDFRYVN